MRGHCRWWPVLLGLLAAQPAWGQNDLARRGFWIGFGVGPGFAWLDCEECGPVGASGPWEGGAGAYLSFALGGTVRSNLLLGGEVSGWARFDESVWVSTGTEASEPGA
jgi:hypothetical protein